MNMCALARRHQDTICPLCLTVSQYLVLDRDGGADHQDGGPDHPDGGPDHQDDGADHLDGGADHRDGGPNHRDHGTCQAQ